MGMHFNPEEANYIPSEKESSPEQLELFKQMELEDLSEKGPAGEAEMERQLREAQDDSGLHVSSWGKGRNGNWNVMFDKLRKGIDPKKGWGEYNPDLYKNGQAS